MTTQPDLFPNEQTRRVPHAEGIARLRALRESIKALPEPPLQKIYSEIGNNLLTHPLRGCFIPAP